MGYIEYKPHCSKCGQIIDTDVYCRVFEVDLGINNLKRIEKEIHPMMCPYCGTDFAFIGVPNIIKEEK